MAQMQINPQFQEIGQQFVKTYYQIFDNDRQNIGSMYSDASMMTFEGQQFQGAQQISQKLIPFSKVAHNIVTVDCQPNPENNGVIVFVTGDLKVDDNAQALKFAQVFHLRPTPQGGFFVLNDLFRLNYG